MAVDAPAEESGAPGCPAWMLTYSDTVTLLCTFFILLLTFSSFDDEDFKVLSNSLGGMSKPGIFSTHSRSIVCYSNKRTPSPL